MEYSTELESTINDMAQTGRGILAADESTPTIAKRFKAIEVESTVDNRIAWRSLLVTTPGLGEYISGLIMFEETLTQKTDSGQFIQQAAWSQKIVPGIKVDQGKIPLALSPGDLITQGLDGLAERLQAYKSRARVLPNGVKFIISINMHRPNTVSKRMPKCWLVMRQSVRQKASYR